MENRKIKYTNYWLELGFFIFFYISIIFAIYLAKISVFIWLLPVILIFWKIFAYPILFPKAIKGLNFYKNKDYENGILMFEGCLEKIHRNKFLDDFKAILLFNSLKISFKSIFYTHIINSYILLENKEEAKLWLERFIKDEPYSKLAEIKSEELEISIPKLNYEQKMERDLLYKPIVVWDVIQSIIILFIMYMLVINSTGPFNLSLLMFILVCIFSFWKFGLFALCFAEVIKTKKSNLDTQIMLYEKGLKKIEKDKYLDKFRFILFLNINKVSYREIFLFKLCELYAKKMDMQTANMYLKILQKEYKDFDFLKIVL